MGLLCFQFAFIQKLSMRLWRAVMKRTSPFVAGDLQATIVALEESMMHLVMKGSQCQPVLAPENQAFVTSMRGGGRKGVVL